MAPSNSALVDDEVYPCKYDDVVYPVFSCCPAENSSSRVLMPVLDLAGHQVAQVDSPKQGMVGW
eukprot:7785598-Karenia_brevis.AAC.1